MKQTQIFITLFAASLVIFIAARPSFMLEYSITGLIFSWKIATLYAFTVAVSMAVVASLIQLKLKQIIGKKVQGGKPNYPRPPPPHKHVPGDPHPKHVPTNAKVDAKVKCGTPYKMSLRSFSM